MRLDRRKDATPLWTSLGRQRSSRRSIDVFSGMALKGIGIPLLS